MGQKATHVFLDALWVALVYLVIRMHIFTNNVFMIKQFMREENKTLY